MLRRSMTATKSAVALSAIIALLPVSSASASESPLTPPPELTENSSAQAVQSVVGFEDSLMVAEDGSVESAEIDTPDHVTLNTDPDKNLLFQSESNDDEIIEISLPDNINLSDGKVINDSILAYTNDAENSSITAESVEGALRIHSVIGDAEASNEFSYMIDLPANTRHEIQEDGSVVFSDEIGEAVLIVAPPWALDRHGNQVPTSYTYADGYLIQHIDTSGVEHADYPVIADPLFGRALFHKMNSSKRYNGQIVYSGTKTRFGQLVHNGVPVPGFFAGSVGAGQVIMRNQGWSEWKSKWPAVSNKATLYQQYSCHVLGGFYNFAGDWNLERARRDNSSWLHGVAGHRCNW